ncbi:MAG: IS256 family transposase [Pseudomonadota bacterium]|nr:IS256 family transposase [Gammaproteobacteria bacterium]MBU1927339.1 IS256 family transposase [Gammaproteobacteria bacterium]
MSKKSLDAFLNAENQLDFEAYQQHAIEALKSGKPLMGEDGIATPLIKKIIEAALVAEADTHVAETKTQNNRRNGIAHKTVQSSIGSFDLETPRDRNGSFEPELVKKRQTILNATLDNKILGLYGIGMSYDDIRNHLSEMYGVDVSPATISAITDQLLPVIAEWRSRPLESVYPILFLDAMFFKVREDGKVVTKAIYNLLGINQSGYKEILGFYIADSEGAHFWLGVLNDLKARGVEDILIACVDGLTGFPEAIKTAFPKTEVQLCVVHQIRHSLKYIASADQKEFLRDLKTVYKAATKDLAESNLKRLEGKWGKKYPMVIKSWKSKWESLSTYFKYSPEIRRLIYTTNAIEGFHRQLRKYTKSKGSFTSENALLKLIYCAAQRIKEKWNMSLSHWALTISQLDIYFEGRIKVEL